MLRAVQDVIILRVPEKPDKSAGGIYFGKESKTKSCEGTVIAVGPGRKTKRGKRIPVSLQVGDKVLFEHGRGIRIRWEDEPLVVMREPDVCMVMDEFQGNEYDAARFYEQKEIVY